jgi:hypothetical protein
LRWAKAGLKRTRETPRNVAILPETRTAAYPFAKSVVLDEQRGAL